MPVSNPESKAARSSQLSLPYDTSGQNTGIYVHWPFCARKCPYCDFNSHVRDTIDTKAWHRALLKEIETFAAHFPNLKAQSLFFGGGTPSLMPPETVAAVIEAVRQYWHSPEDMEITLEANPSSVEAERFKAYAQAGVNRVSLGIQSFKDDELKFLGRLHSAHEAEHALDVARDNFKRVSFDLIYALPEQSLEDWRKALGYALTFAPSHLSLYQLTIEEGTAFYHQYQRGKFTLPDEDAAADLYNLTQEMCSAAGLPAYETSNHARAGEHSRHNMVYWRGEPYVGIGPGAHGRLPNTATGGAIAHMQIKRPEDWLQAVETSGVGLQDMSIVSPQERAVEAIMMGLRLTTGINRHHFQHLFGGSTLDDHLDPDGVAALVQAGYLENTADTLKTTGEGRLLVNQLLPRIIR